MMKNILIGSLLIFLLLIATSITGISAKQAQNYQIYRLTEHPADDRRPKLAINENVTVWIAWESDRDGDFDIYGRKFKNGEWSELVEIESDSAMTFLNDLIAGSGNKIAVISTRADSLVGIVKIIGTSFYNFINGVSISTRQYLCNSTFFNPLLGSYELTPGEPKAIFFDEKTFICYHRSQETDATYQWEDSLFIKQLNQNILSSELLDTTFSCWKATPYGDKCRFPYQRILLKTRGLFLIKNYNDPGYYPYPRHDRNIGLVISDKSENKYILLCYNTGEYGHGKEGINTDCCGSATNSVFIAGYYVRTNKKIIREIDIDVNDAAVVRHEWRIDYHRNITISQMSDLVAFAWIDNSTLFVKPYKDSIWHKTQEIPFENVQKIGLRFNSLVYDNELIWISFDAISNNNKDVYAVSLTVCKEIDSTLTSVQNKVENSDLPEDFRLFQNYPNPFNSTTDIKYSIPQGKFSPNVRINIYDIKGRLMKVLVDQDQSAGMHSVKWDGKDMIGNSVVSGIYFYILQAGRQKMTKKMSIVQ